MKKAGIFFADGFEEIEALTAVDLLRRAGIETDMISIASKTVEGVHGIRVIADKLLSETDFDQLDMIILPGGGPGTDNLEACGELMEQLDLFYQKGEPIAAICAAPGILGHRGMLKGRKACSYPAREDQLEGAEVVHDEAVLDGNIITGRGAGCAIPFALLIVEYFQGQKAADDLAEAIVYTRNSR